ncbi:MAG: DUF2142 domain-containing protein [Bacilli bacterium]|nr:DUF2142 domain-containing protein [Bacilli bacterium]
MKKKKILLFVLLLIPCIAFELFFCNSLFLKGKSGYVFSFARIFLYALLFFIEYKISNRIINNRLDYEKEKKRNLIDFFFVICFSIVIIVDILFIVLGKTNLMSQGIVISLLCYIAFLFFFYSSNYKLNIIMICCVCFIYSMVVTPQHAIDETTHFVSSYNLSKFDYNWSNGYEIDSNLYKITQYKNYKYNEELFVHYKADVIDGKTTNYKPYSICKYLYIPSSIGITVSRLLDGTIMDTFYMGRFFNALTTLIGIAILLKLIDKKKNVYLAIVTTPYFLLLGSTYNVDAIGNLSLFIFVAYILKLYKSKDKYLTKKNVLFITILMLLITLYKGASYFLIFLLLILIYKKIPKNKKWFIPIYFIVFLVLIYLQMKPEALNTGDVSVTGTPDPMEQIKFLFSSPLNIVKVYGGHFINCFLSAGYYEGLLGTHFYPLFASYITLPYILFLLYMGLSSNEETYSKKTNILILITSLLLFFFTSTGLYLGYTGVGRLNIEGYQARYMYPIILLLLLIIGNKRINILKDKKYDIINYSLILFLNMLFIFIIVYTSINEAWF